MFVVIITAVIIMNKYKYRNN